MRFRADAIKRADVIAMSLPDTPKTDNFLSREIIEQLKEGAYVINVGRGNSINTDALCDGLESGKIAGAALDVFEVEPLPADHRLWKIPSVLVTPHATGGFTLPKTQDFIVDLACRNLSAYFAGEKPESIASLKEGY